jgi:hypothetical protein
VQPKPQVARPKPKPAPAPAASAPQVQQPQQAQPTAASNPATPQNITLSNAGAPVQTGLSLSNSSSQPIQKQTGDLLNQHATNPFTGDVQLDINGKQVSDQSLLDREEVQHATDRFKPISQNSNIMRLARPNIARLGAPGQFNPAFPMIAQNPYQPFANRMMKGGSLLADSAFVEGVKRELEEHSKKAEELEKTSEQLFLSLLRDDLMKLAEEHKEASAYSKEDLEYITSSSETFFKMARLEAETVWKGISEELLKQGADQDFLDGMLKEAAIPWAAVLRAPLTALATGAKVLGAGKEKAVENVLNLAKKAPSLGAMTDNLGNVISHTETMPSHLKGSRSLGFGNELEQRLRSSGNLSPRIQESLDAAKGENLEKLRGQLSENTQNAFQSHVNDIYNKGRLDMGMSPTADQLLHQSHLNDMVGGDFSEVARRMNVHPDVMKTHMGTDVLNDAQNYSKNLADAGFNSEGVEHYSKAMNASARNNKPVGSGGGSFMGARFDPSRGVARALGGTALGSLVGMPILGGAIGGLTGTFGTAPVALGGAALGGTLGYKAVKGVGNALGLGGQDKEKLDSTGALEDRHRILPFMSNKGTGAIGGALLAMLIANHMGYQGPMSWMIPILGGVAGYNYLPQMMNKWKDPYGVGENSISPLAAKQNQQYAPGR